MNDSIFFINALPPNDRRSDLDYVSTLDFSIQKSCDLGFKHTLITIGDKRYDPWVLAQYGLSKNVSFKPLIATNPIHQHPVALAKRLISLKSIFSTEVALNLVSGSFVSELKSIGNNLNFEQRNERLIEFLKIIQDLGSTSSTYSFNGKYYQIENVDLYPRTLTSAKNSIFISGHFEAQLPQYVNEAIYFVKNYRPLDQLQKAFSSKSGLNVGICARSTDAEAMSAVHDLYPMDRQGEMLFTLAVNNNETPWNIWIKDYLKKNRDDDPLFYLKPFKNYQSSAPFIVGSYEKVAEHLKKCTELNYNFFILDYHRSDHDHIKVLMQMLKPS
ncbi:LLM class flavin-dependent oxidoreductase [bacterium]|nr:LLM class flavin-dependent oxidoreductase [bacterium]